MLAAWLITTLMITSFPQGHRDLIPSQFVLGDWPSSSCSSTADEVATSSKDVATWWETVIECPSNTSQSSLQELDLIDWLPALRLNPLRKARSSGSCYWFDRCSPLMGKRACRGAARTGPAGFLFAAAIVMSVLWYADVPDLLFLTARLCHPALTGITVCNCSRNVVL